MQAPVFSCTLPGITLQMQHPPGLFESVRERNSEKLNVIIAYLTTPAEGSCTALCFTWFWCSVCALSEQSKLSRATSSELHGPHQSKTAIA